MGELMGFKQMDGQIEKQTEGWIVGWTDDRVEVRFGFMDGQIYRWQTGAPAFPASVAP